MPNEPIPVTNWKKISELPSTAFNGGSILITQDVVSGAPTNLTHTLSETAVALFDSFSYTQADLETVSKIPVQAVAEIMQNMNGKVLTGTLEAGDTSITFTDTVITTSMSYDYYTSNHCEPTSVTVSSGQVVYTFEEQEEDVTVKVVVF